MNTNTIVVPTVGMEVTTTAPAQFAKGSGKKIAAAFTDPAKGWTVHFIPASWGGCKMVAHAPNINMEVTVSENGSFISASIVDLNAGNKWSHTLDTATETVNAANLPTTYAEQARRAAEEAARKQARDERAVIVQAEFAAIKDTDADEQRWERRALVRIAEQELSFSIDNRYSASSQMSEATTIIQKNYEVVFAKRILAMEGRYNELTDRAWTLAEAVTKIIMEAVSDSDATRYETAVPHAKAVQRIANRYAY